MPEQARRAELAARLRRLRQPLYRQSAFLLGGAGITAATGFVFWLAAARLVDPGELGTAAGLVAAVALINYLTGFGLPQGLLRYSGDFRVSVSELTNAAILITAASSLIGALTFAAGASLWAPALQHDLSSPVDLALFAIFCIGVSVGLVLDSALTARRRGQWALARAGIMSAGKLVGLPLLAAGGAIGLYIAMSAPIVLASVCIYLLLPVILPTFRRGAVATSKSVPEFAGYSLRTFPANLFAGAPLLLPLIVSGLLGSRQTAFYYVAWSFAAILQLRSDPDIAGLTHRNVLAGPLGNRFARPALCSQPGGAGDSRDLRGGTADPLDLWPGVRRPCDVRPPGACAGGSSLVLLLNQSLFPADARPTSGRHFMLGGLWARRLSRGPSSAPCLETWTGWLLAG